MKKRNYERVLCELLVKLLIKGSRVSERDELASVLLMAHPFRESAFVDWATRGFRSIPHLTLVPAHDITLVGEYL